MKLKAGSLTLEGHRLYFGNGRPLVKITPIEAHLLALLMQSPGQVVSRAMIMREVWQTDYLGDTRTLDVHICSLRQKLEDDPTRPQLLLTRRGVGYELNVPKADR
jgi:DNA-binding response OmpR family regulator